MHALLMVLFSAADAIYPWILIFSKVLVMRTRQKCLGPVMWRLQLVGLLMNWLIPTHCFWHSALPVRQVRASKKTINCLVSIFLKLATSNNSICLTFTRCAKRVELCIEQRSQLLALFAVKAIGLQIALKATRIDALDFVECFYSSF